MAPYAHPPLPSATTKMNRPRVTPVIPLPFTKTAAIQQRRPSAPAVEEPTQTATPASARAFIPEKTGIVDGPIEQPLPSESRLPNEKENGTKREKEEGGNGVRMASRRVIAPVSESPPSEAVDGTNGTDGAQKRSSRTKYAPSNALSKSQHSSTPKIPEELPPPFYPASDKRSTPTSTTSSSFPPPQYPNRGPPIIHHPQPHANGLVFGGYADSSSSSPAPLSAGYMGYAPNGPAVQHQYQNGPFAPIHIPPPSHGRHISDHLSPVIYPPGLPSGYPPGPAPGHWYQQGAQLPYGGIANGPYPQFNSAQGKPDSPVSRSVSRASTHTQPSGIRGSGSPAPLANGHHNVTPFENGTTVGSHQNGLSNMAVSNVNDWEGVHRWLLQHFDNPELADYMLEITHSRGITSVPIHSFLAARSPYLKSVITDAQRSNSGNILKLSLTGFFIDEPTIKHAVKYLYSGYLPSIHEAIAGLPSLDPYDQEPAQYHLKFAIGYAAFCSILQLPALTSHGIEMVRALLRLDNVEMLLVAVTSVFEDSMPTVQLRNVLVNTLVSFIVHSIPPTFELDVLAPPLSQYSRLPTTSGSRPSTANPRLSLIQFGDAPQARDFMTTTLSSILLSLPPFLVDMVFENSGLQSFLGLSKIAELMNSVVNERENRRIKAVNSKDSSVTTEDSPFWQAVYWEEHVEQASPSAVPHLKLEWRGPKAPTKPNPVHSDA